MNFFKEYKKQILILLAVILSITAVISVGKKTKANFFDNALGFVVEPIQGITTGISGWFGDRIASIKNEADIFEENKELKATIELLESENKRLSLYEDENEKMSALLDLAQKYPQHKTVGAYVTGKDPGNWYDMFMISKGSDDGVEFNMVLMDEGGVVGRIIEVGKGYAKAQSILDNRSSVAAMSLRTGDLGVVRGDFTLTSKGLCKMEYIDADSEIMQGDEIVTSHLSDVYPPGLTVGVVKEIVIDANGLTKYAVIEPKVDFKHLTTLLVITGIGEEVNQQGVTQGADE